MKIAFYDTKPYDITWFKPLSEQYGYKIKFFENKLNSDTAVMAQGYDAVCAFVNDTIDEAVIGLLHGMGIQLLALRCAGYNNVDMKAALGKLRVVRVPNYSPAAVAEHAAALLMTVNRKTHRAYIRTRDNNFNINGLMGMDLAGKTAGIIGTGKIGQSFIRICRGFGMDVLAYDPYPAALEGVTYVQPDELFRRSDVISLHCPLTADTRYIIDAAALAVMKPHAILINTSRGALIHTADLIEALRDRRIGGAGLDVYEEEGEYFFEDFSNEIVMDDELTRLLSLPNVVLTSHQGFFTQEAMEAIAKTTMANISAFERGETLENEVCAICAP